MISAENLTKSFGSQVLLDGVSFKINTRERVGLVGRNGHGKTTLFRMIVGEDRPDDGVIVIPRNYRIGYVRQEISQHPVHDPGCGNLARGDLLKSDLQIVQGVVPGLVHAGGLAGGAHEHPREEIGQARVMLPVADQALHQIGLA